MRCVGWVVLLLHIDLEIHSTKTIGFDCDCYFGLARIVQWQAEFLCRRFGFVLIGVVVESAGIGGDSG